MEVLGLKLITGEEIVARVAQINTDTYEVESPKAIIPAQGPDGNLGMHSYPWILSNPEGTFEIPASKVVTTFTPVEGIVRRYIEDTSRILLG